MFFFVLQLAPGSVLSECLWSSAFAVSSHVAESFQRSSALLCGDAAHCHPPSFGQGMNTGIQVSLLAAAALNFNYVFFNNGELDNCIILTF